RTSSSSARARCTQRCTASKSASGLPPSGGCPSTTGGPSSTSSPRAGGNNCAPRPRRGNGSSRRSRSCCARRSSRADMPSSRWPPDHQKKNGNARRELDDELGFHLDTLVQDLIASGVSPEVARAEAERRFGTVSDIRDACLTIDRRRARRLAFKEYVHMISQDIRHVARAMRNAPGFAAVVTLTLALGVGATTAMYSVLDAVVLHPLAYAQSDRMVMVYDVERDAVQLIGAQSSWNLPAMLGLRPIIGRLFRADEEGPGRNGVVILSEALWKQSFSGDSAVVGRPITLTGKPFVVIGVVADGARDVIPDPWHIASGKEAEFWIPLDFSVKTAPRDLRFMTVVGRLAPGITLAQASQRIGIMAAGLRREGVTTDSVRIAPLTSAVVGDLRQPLELMLAAVGVLLAIACANIANLLLAHTASRRRELAVRAALGAGRQRLLGLLFVESLARALIGGACGVGLAYLALAAAHRWLATALPR